MKMEPRKFLDILKTVAAEKEQPQPVDEFRDELETEGAKTPLAEGITASDAELGGVACLQLFPETAEKGHILHLHGGGYTAGSPRSHQCMSSVLPAKSGMKLWSLDYRLAPENPFPAAIEDTVAAYQGLLEIAGSPDQIFIAGDSAGGGLAIASMVKAKEMGLPMPAGLVLMSPWTNANNESWSHTHNVDKDFLTSFAMLTSLAGLYAPDLDRSHPLLSPAFADLSGLPPMLIHVGGEEVLLSDSTLLAERAAGAGVEVTLKIWPDMPHVFQLFIRFLQPADQSLGEMADWMTARIG